MPNRRYERIKQISDTLPLSSEIIIEHAFSSGINNMTEFIGLSRETEGIVAQMLLV